MADERKKGEKGGEREDVPRGERAGGEALCTVGRGGVAEEEEMPPNERYERANERVSRKQQRKKRQEI